MHAVLVVEFRIKPANIAEFDRAIRHNAQQSLNLEDGCLRFDVCRDPADEALFFLYEIYENEAAIQAHLVSPHFLEMNAATTSWVATKSVRGLSL